MKHEIQKLCQEAKDKYNEDKCREIEMLDRTHNQKTREMRPKRNDANDKSKQGKCIMEKEVLERWAEYVEELNTYSDGIQKF